MLSKIKRWRQLNGFTQKEAAFVIGVAENTIRNWERGRAPMSMDKERHISLLSTVWEMAGIHDKEEKIMTATN